MSKNIYKITASPEEIEKQRVAQYNIFNYDSPVFAACSLGDWIDLIETNKVSIPYVPADLIFEEKVSNLLFFDSKGEEYLKSLNKKLKYANNFANDPNYMLRWDQCSSSNIKFHMGREDNAYEVHTLENIDPENKKLVIDDFRFFNMLYTFPYENMRAYKRSIINPVVKDNYPVEFRVFVEKGKILGVSNYYPQIDLAFNDFYLKLAQKACSHTKKLIKACKSSNCYPVMPNSPREITFTADFIVSRNSNNVIFLEAGPGFGYGAHPCCFYDPNVPEEPVLIQGIALSNNFKKANAVVWQDYFESKKA